MRHNLDDLYICERCGGVALDGCSECGEVAKGCTAGDIKAAIDLCETVGHVVDCRGHYSRHIATLRKKRGDAGVAAIQIENMVRYKKICINGEAQHGHGK